MLKMKTIQNDLRKQDNFKQLASELGIREDRDILRCEGRLANSDLESDAKTSVILSRQHRFKRLVIEERQQRVHHSGVKGCVS